MNNITKETFDSFKERFCKFYDSVVKRIEITFSPHRMLICELQAKDNESERGWSTVTLKLSEFSEFKFSYGQTTFEVLSSGVGVFWIDGKVALFLDAYPDDEGVPAKDKNTAYALGGRLEVSDIKEIFR